MASNTLLGLDALDTVPVTPRDRQQDPSKAWRAAWPKLAALVIVWVIWELIHLSGWKKYVIPGPGVTLSNLWDQAQTGVFWSAVGTTMERAGLGYALALLIGIVVGSLVSRVRPLRAAVGSLITGLQIMPSLVWFPFAIILFGITTQAILFVIAMAGAPSIANALIAGVGIHISRPGRRRADRDHRQPAVARRAAVQRPGPGGHDEHGRGHDRVPDHRDRRGHLVRRGEPVDPPPVAARAGVITEFLFHRRVPARTGSQPCNLIPPFDDISRRGVPMEHVEAVVTATELELDEALATAIRQFITGALDADARSQPAPVA